MLVNKALALALNRISFLKDDEKTLMAEVLASPHDLLDCSLTDISAITGRKLRTETWQPQEILAASEQDFSAMEKGEFQLLVRHSAEYPVLLSEIYDPPFVLYVRGDKAALHLKSAAVVGTREPHEKAASAAFKWGLAFACENICTVSGLALGIDTAVHKGTLSIQGKTVAVLGSGTDEIYPRRNAVLARSILESGGAIVSEFPPGTRAAKYNFPKRNRIISGLSGAVLIIQAPEKSGALITADYALDQGREVYVDAVCAPMPANGGCMSLLYNGAKAVTSLTEMHFVDVPVSGIKKIRKNEYGRGKDIARIMELELTGSILRYKNSFFMNEENGGQVAG